MSFIEYRLCRGCREHDLTTELVHYSTRCYAHPVCLYKRGNEAALMELHAWQLEKFPVLLMIKAGLSYERLDEIIEAKRGLGPMQTSRAIV